MSDTSAEHPNAMDQVEAEPDFAGVLFGSGVTAARIYADDLVRDGETLGLLGPRELPRLWTRHLVNSVLLAPLLGPGRVADVGSGAGLPGIPLAIARPDVRIVLIEPMERRSDWLRAEAARLELDNIEVVRARAEEVEPRAFDQVTARAVGALRTLIPLAARLVRPGGELLLLKGARGPEELAAAAPQVRRARLVDSRFEALGGGVESEGTQVFRARVD